MSVDNVLRAIATLTCMYTAGLFITLTSIAALNVSGYDPDCGPSGCMMASLERPYITPVRHDPAGISALATVFDAQKI